jgi:acyl-CoA synthetase (AMP-forming)/AMP-acid ligase II
MTALAATERFETVCDRVAYHAGSSPARLALVENERRVSYLALDGLVDRVAAAFQRECIGPRDIVAVVAANSIEYVAVFLGALRAGAAVAPLPVGATAEQLHVMLRDSGARLVFADAGGAERLGALPPGFPPLVRLDMGFENWLAPETARPAAVAIQPDCPFNIIYSSGTTGTPKGIVQPHVLRSTHIRRAAAQGYDADSAVMIAVPMYSNTCLAGLFAALAYGGTAVVMPKFDASAFLRLAERHRATHATLVPVMYQRILEHPDFDRTDLGAFKMKFSSGSHFPQALKRQAVERWPGRLLDLYGMTEGGVSTALDCTAFPDKLHTVGRPAADTEIRLIDAEGRDVTPGEPGEIVGRSAAMMTGYHNRPDATREVEWFDEQGRRFIRSGDIGRIDADGFIQLLDRRKDMIISGGFKIYPADLENVLRGHPAVRDVSVVGAPSAAWGETPVAFAVAPGADAESLKTWANERLGKMQRLSEVRLIAELPRNPAGKILKRELRSLCTAR